MFKNIDEVEKCVVVLQGEIALSHSSDKNPVLYTFGLGPCHGISIYNKINKKGLLMHIDSLTKFNIFHNIYNYLDIDDKNNIDINIISGQGDNELLKKIYKKLNVINLLDRIVGVSLGNYDSILKLDTKTGNINNMMCKNYKDRTIDVSKIIIEKELYKLYGFELYEEIDNISWYDKEHNDIPLIEGSLELIFNFPEENKENTFDNYIENEDNTEIYNYCKKFANQVVNKTLKDSSYYLMLSGNPGIGKTFLSVAIAKYVYNHGKNVLFVNSHELSNYFQELEGDINKLYNFMNNIIYNKDLIIIDDLTSKYDITGYYFLNKVKEYIELNGKSLLITSNIDISDILDDYDKIQNYNKKNILIYNLNIERSLREPWIENISPSIIEDPIKLLSEYNDEKPAGIVIIDQETNRTILENYKIIYLNNIKDISTKIRLTDEPFGSDSKVKDLYVHDLKNYDIVITKVNTNSEGGQLINMINNIYNHKMKLIIITQSLEILKRVVSYNLNIYELEKFKQRYIDRLNVITPGIEYDY